MVNRVEEIIKIIVKNNEITFDEYKTILENLSEISKIDIHTIRNMADEEIYNLHLQKEYEERYGEK